MFSAIINNLLARRSHKPGSEVYPVSPAFGRKLRMFDIEMIAPFDHKALVAFLKADKLSELTTEQIRVFLLLRDTVAPEGLTAGEIAEELDITASSARFAISTLKHNDYVLRSSVERCDARGQQIVAWVYDPEHWMSDEHMLYWEFGCL